MFLIENRHAAAKELKELEEKIDNRSAGDQLKANPDASYDQTKMEYGKLGTVAGRFKIQEIGRITAHISEMELTKPKTTAGRKDQCIK